MMDDSENDFVLFIDSSEDGKEWDFKIKFSESANHLEFIAAVEAFVLESKTGGKSVFVEPDEDFLEH